MTYTGKRFVGKKRRKWIFVLLLVISIAVFLFSGIMLLYELVIVPTDNRNQLDEYQQMYPGTQSSSQAVVSEPATSEMPSVSSEAAVESTVSQPTEVLEKFDALLAHNADIGGWLTMPDTELNHPVFYTPWDQNYYLKRNPDGSYNKYGSLYLSAGSSLNPQAQVMVMYGHNMEQDDLMFGQLNKYKKLSFLQEHPTFTFDTIYQEGTWKIIAVCRAATDELSEFAYNTTHYATEEAFDAFIKQARIRSMYRIDDDVCAEDALLVMSTCDYLFYGDRLVVVARRLRPDERAEAVQTEDYSMNDVMLWPDAYYALDYIKAVRPTDEQIQQGYIAYYGE